MPSRASIARWRRSSPASTATTSTASTATGRASSQLVCDAGIGAECEAARHDALPSASTSAPSPCGRSSSTCATGATMATASTAYARRRHRRALPWRPGATLGADWALQNPADWLDGARDARCAGVLAASGVDRRRRRRPRHRLHRRARCCPTDAVGMPLCQIDGLAGRATRVAQALEAPRGAAPGRARHRPGGGARGARGCRGTAGGSRRSGCCPRHSRCSQEAPDGLRARGTRSSRAATGSCGSSPGRWRAMRVPPATRACGTSARATRRDDYLQRTAIPGFERLLQREGRPAVRRRAGTRVGTLTPAWAARLGLGPDAAVAAPIIDAHAAVLGGGVGERGAARS